MNVMRLGANLVIPIWSANMLRPLSCLLCLCGCLWGTALATEVNQASEAELDGLRGIGPALSGRILLSREQGVFRDWEDLMRRVKGISAKSAHRLSQEGLTVNGQSYRGSPPADSPAAVKPAR